VLQICWHVRLQRFDDSSGVLFMSLMAWFGKRSESGGKGLADSLEGIQGEGGGREAVIGGREYMKDVFSPIGSPPAD
jgi:hypothetical protein